MMGAVSRGPEPGWDGLVGREWEKAALLSVLGVIDSGTSAVAVVAGQAGIGKTALLSAFEAHVAPRRVLRVSGIESDLELAFAGIHQLCAPLLGELTKLPEPQQTALRVVFGLSEGTTPDRFIVGLAVLGLLAHAAADGPVVCLVDDFQWLDLASAKILGFVARRLVAESVAIVFGTRDPAGELSGLDRLELTPLSKPDARVLLDSVLPTSVDERVREQIVAESRGYPLDIVELQGEVALAELAGGFGLPAAFSASKRAEELYRRRFAEVSGPERQLLVLAAADPTGDIALLRRALAMLGLDSLLGVGAADAGLLQVGVRVQFCHPLARSAVYRYARPAEVRQAHAALAEATDPETDPDRRAWHCALALDRPDDGVALKLEHSAKRAEARGGLSAAAAFLQRSALLSVDPYERARRAVTAAETQRRAGDPDAARDLLSVAETGPIRDVDRARAGLVRVQLEVTESWGGATPSRLLEAAGRLRTLDLPLARMAHLEAIWASAAAAQLASGEDDLAATIRAAGELPAASSIREATALIGTLGLDETLLPPPLGPLMEVLRWIGDPSSYPDGGLRWFSLAALVASNVWDTQRWDEFSDRQLQLCRRQGAATDLPIALSSRVFLTLATGDLDAAAVRLEELIAISAANGNPVALAEHATLVHAALRGRAAEFEPMFRRSVDNAERRGEGIGVNIGYWAKAVFENGRGEYQAAASAAERAAMHAHDAAIRNHALTEAIEALSRTGNTADAERYADQLASALSGQTQDWGRGIRARTQALVAQPEDAEALYAEAVELLDRAGLRGELARARLLRGEWLRRARRRSEARTELRTARALFDEIGMSAFAGRAARELWATGESAPPASSASQVVLTPQETQISRLARDGLTNPEIGSRLYISARTVEYHLSKVFIKLGISARTQLAEALD